MRTNDTSALVYRTAVRCCSLAHLINQLIETIELCRLARDWLSANKGPPYALPTATPCTGRLLRLAACSVAATTTRYPQPLQHRRAVCASVFNIHCCQSDTALQPTPPACPPRAFFTTTPVAGGLLAQRCPPWHRDRAKHRTTQTARGRSPRPEEGICFLSYLLPARAIASSRLTPCPIIPTIHSVCCRMRCSHNK